MKIIIVLLIALLAITIASPAVSATQGIRWIISDPTAYVLKGFVTYSALAINNVDVHDGNTTTNSTGYYELSGLTKNINYDVNYTRYGFLDNTSQVNNTVDANPYWNNVSLNGDISEPLVVHSQDGGCLIPGFNILMTIMIIFIVRRLLK